jgi:hypothetical protein
VRVRPPRAAAALVVAAAPAVGAAVATARPPVQPRAEAAPPAARALRAGRVGPRWASPLLGEASGLAASARAPGLVWVVGDGGAPAELFAVAAAGGRVLGRVRVAGAANVDWEALAPGPCGPAAGGRPSGADGPPPCLYVGDVGDNAAGRAAVTLYRVPEPLGAWRGPVPRGRGRRALRLPAATAPAESLRVRYADGPRDVEAMAVLPDGDVWLVTKHPLARADGGARPVLVYRVPAAAWGAPGPATARLVDSLPVVPDRTITHRVTDAAFDPARRLLVVRTYLTAYLVPLAGPPWRVDRARRATACDLGALREPQGEGVAVVPGPAVTLLLASESNLLGPGGLAWATCPPAG